jgi:hypothetical protein
MSLAYVFWHRPRPGVARQAYESALVAFHESLKVHPPAGFQRSHIYRISPPPWFASDSDAYEDWYLIDDSAAMDPLNEAAISGARQAPHDRIAQMAGGGTAGLYLLRRGSPDEIASEAMYWFGKPDGESYAKFYDRFSSREGFGLWGRQMVLGPGPEFCLAGRDGAPPALDRVVTVRVERVW